MKGRSHFSNTEVEQLKILITQKLKADSNAQKGIRNKIRKIGFYASDFGLRGGYTVSDFLHVITTDDTIKTKTVAATKTTSLTKAKTAKGGRKDSDEAYIINICDKVLQEKAIRQHRFDFLRGDSGVKLPVDAFYVKHNLVIEYMEKQHSEPVEFFDKKQTVSGVGRGEQRKMYDERKKILIPENGINFLALNYSEFKHRSNKTLLRDLANDEVVIKLKLEKYL
ncbi:MAG: hypothetical protein JKX79_12660 [Labilibaculum sp.]|nr:hypothetical protein [Labilibaculum sp.]